MNRYWMLVIALAVAAPAFAQTAPAAPLKGFWVDVNLISLTPLQKEQSYTWEYVDFFGETETYTTKYPAMPSAIGAGITAGYQARNGIGFGLAYTAATYTYTVGLSIRIPSPEFYNTYASDSTVTEDALERKDKSLDLSLTYAPTLPDNWTMRVFGGPTYFSVSQEMVNDIRFHQIYGIFLPTNSVDITEYESKVVKGSSWGFHAGLDVGYFFAKHFGVGGGLRFNVGSVDIDEPLSETTQSLKLGGVQIGGGLRMRF